MKILVLIIPFLFTGCLFFNERGVDIKYYNKCKEYYDAQGFYHKECDKNLIEYKDLDPKKLKELLKKSDNCQ